MGRPIHADPPLNDLQKAEEMIKREMILMMHHDCLETPTLAQQGAGGSKHKDRERGIVNESVHRGYLDRHPYKEVSTEDMMPQKSFLRLRWRWLKPECNTETCPSMPTLRSGKNVWPRFSSFPGNSDTQGDPVIILRISMKFANIVLAQGQPCLQEGPHRVA